MILPEASSPSLFNHSLAKVYSAAWQDIPEDIQTHDEVTEANKVSIWALAVKFSDR
jgi:hypothetical protein